MFKALNIQAFSEDQWAMFPPLIQDFARTTMYNFRELSEWMNSDGNYLRSNYDFVARMKDLGKRFGEYLSLQETQVATVQAACDKRIATLREELDFRLGLLDERHSAMQQLVADARREVSDQGALLRDYVDAKFGRAQRPAGPPPVRSEEGSSEPVRLLAEMEERYAQMLSDLYTKANVYSETSEAVRRSCQEAERRFEAASAEAGRSVASLREQGQDLRAELAHLLGEMHADRGRFPPLEADIAAVRAQTEGLAQAVAAQGGHGQEIEALGARVGRLQAALAEGAQEADSLRASVEQGRASASQTAQQVSDALEGVDGRIAAGAEEARAETRRLAASVADLEEDLLFQLNNCKSLIVGSNIYKEYEIFRQKLYEDMLVEGKRDEGFSFLTPLEMRIHRLENMLIDHLARPDEEPAP